jgi:hypothetical protein
MRARNIKPGFFLNELLAECDPLARLLFTGLWCMADREGRLEDRPKKIKATLLPFDDCDIEELLNQLADRGFILRYSAAGLKCIQVIKFSEHQKPYCREQQSKLPPPPAEPMQCHSTDQAVPGHEKDGAEAVSGQCHSSPDSSSRITDTSSRITDIAASQPPPSAEQPIAPEEEVVKRQRAKTARKAPKEREPDPLFDALAELTGSDPHTSASHIGKVAKALRAADPPYSPDEIKRLPDVLARDMPYIAGRLTLGTVQKYVGLLRAKPLPNGGSANGAKRNPSHRFYEDAGANA